MVFPIVDRELRVAARKGSSYLGRMMASLVGVVVIGFVLGSMRDSVPTASVAKGAFATLSFICLLYSVFIGARTTAQSIAPEKDDGTLGFLFLTDLNSFDVVFGKLVAGSLGAFYSLLSILPILAIPVLMGGVMVADVWKMALVLINTMGFSLAVGLFVSVISKTPKQAMARTTGILVFFTIGLWALSVGGAAIVAENMGHSREAQALAMAIMGWVNLFNPSAGYFVIQTNGLTGLSIGNALIWNSVAVLLLSFLFLVGAIRLLPRQWQDRPETAGRKKLRERLAEVNMGAGRERAARRAGLLGEGFMVWLNERGRLKRILPWFVLGLVVVIYVCLAIKFDNDWLHTAGSMMTMFTLHLIYRFWLISDSGFRFFEDRRTGAIELLLATTASVDEIIKNQLKAMWRIFLGPTVAVILFDIILFVLSDERDEEYFFIYFMFVVIFIADMLAIPRIAMWQGMNAKSIQKVTGRTSFRVFGIPGLCFVGFMFLMATSGSGINGEGIFFFWFMLCVASDAVFAAQASTRLREDFRTTAAKRYEPPLKGIKGFFLN